MFSLFSTDDGSALYNAIVVVVCAGGPFESHDQASAVLSLSTPLFITMPFY